ncbi:hypothetical protein BC827DRAFT_1223953, partial [Russula dissimulans]
RTSTYLVAQQDFFDPWYAPTPHSVAPSPGDAPWPAFSQSPMETTAGTQGFLRPSWPWIFDPGLLTTASFGYTSVDGSIGAQVAPEYGERFFKFVGPVVGPWYVSSSYSGPTFG